MEIKVNYIYSVPSLNYIGRVDNIKNNMVNFSNGVSVDKGEVKSFLPVGYKVKINGVMRVVTEELETACCHEDSAFMSDDGLHYFLNEFGRPVGEVYPSTNVESEDSPMLKTVVGFFDTTTYNASPLAINKILGKWTQNKERLKSILSKSPYWNDEILALDWEVEFPVSDENMAPKEKYNEIIRIYSRHFPYDYARLNGAIDGITFFDLIDVTDDVNKKAKSFGLHLAVGMKPARAIRKFLTEIKANRIPDFEKKFAELADALSNKTIKRRLTLSIHPMDYLRMSYGNSWQSCHHIGKGGCYSNGTLSYLMDGQSMVCSLLDPVSDEVTYMQPKINRMMFFLNEDGDILQSRLYPQVRNQTVEDIIANEVNEKLAQAMGIDNAFKVVVSDVSCDNYVTSIGSHYRDYACHDFGQRIWSVNDTPRYFTIGHESYCVHCGEPNSNTGSLVCYNCGIVNGFTVDVYYVCPNSGRRFYLQSRTDAKLNPADGRYYLKYYFCEECGDIFFDEHIYCHKCRADHPLICAGLGTVIEGECVFYKGKAYSKEYANEHFCRCKDCGEYILRDDAIVVEDYGIICEDCENNNSDIFYCEDCERYYHTDNVESYYVNNYGTICRGCYEYGGYTWCYHCDELYRDEDLTWIESEERDVCPGCLERDYVRCDRCNEYYYEGDGATVYCNGNAEYWCDNCREDHATWCDHCHNYVPDDEIRNVDGENWCDDCVSDDAVECADCGELIDERNAFYDADTEKWYCESCYDALVETREREREEREQAETQEQEHAFPYIAQFQGDTVTVLNVENGIAAISTSDGTHEHFRFVPLAEIS